MDGGPPADGSEAPDDGATPPAGNSPPAEAAAKPEKRLPGPITQDLAGPYLAARQAASASDFSVAGRFFQRALAQDPADPFLIDSTLVSLVSAGQIERAVTIGRGLHGVPFFLEPLADEARDLPIVLDDENPHGVPGPSYLARRAERPRLWRRRAAEDDSEDLYGITYEAGPDEVFMHPDEWWKEQSVDVRTGTEATAIDTSAPASPGAPVESRRELTADETLTAPSGASFLVAPPSRALVWGVWSQPSRRPRRRISRCVVASRSWSSSTSRSISATCTC